MKEQTTNNPFLCEIIAVLDDCSEYCDGDCVMESNGISCEEAQLRAAAYLSMPIRRTFMKRAPAPRTIGMSTPLAIITACCIAFAQCQKT